ncbi:MAG TPA: TlpA family protein disulfide reductase [Desulfuromonadales bacterium]|nr:TlpA family protein disulfide reductase [Desulfuromonadales bacterium]
MYNVLIIAIAALCISLPTTSYAVIKKGTQLPAFSSTAASGVKVTSTAYSGKVLLLMIASEYCTYCKTAIPYLNRINEHYGKSAMHVQGLIAGPGFGKEALKRYIDSNDVHFPMGFTDSKTIYETIGAYSVPTFLLIDKKGIVAGYFRGYSEINMKLIEKQANTLLAE